jgi:hypothetical protein
MKTESGSELRILYMVAWLLWQFKCAIEEGKKSSLQKPREDGLSTMWLLETIGVSMGA